MVLMHRPVQPGASLARLKTPRTGHFQPIPAPYEDGCAPPFAFDLASVLSTDEVAEIAASGSMAFHCMGDTGGVKDPTPQHLVARGLVHADPGKALIVAVHHPIFSFDTYHSGSPTMAKELEDAINASRRLPNMVLNAHVHNYQRIELSLAGHTIPFFVIGNGGYWNLHHLAAAVGYADPETGAKLLSATDSHHGFMTFEISDTIINGHFTTVPRPQDSWSDAQAYNTSFDMFSYSAAPLTLAEGQTVTLVPADGTNVPPHLDHREPAPEPSPAAASRIAAKHAHAHRTAAKLNGHHAAKAPAGG